MSKLNTAQQLRQALGIESVSDVRKQREVSHTKSGPGRRHADGSGKRRGLRNHFERLNRDAIEARRAKAMERAGR